MNEGICCVSRLHPCRSSLLDMALCAATPCRQHLARNRGNRASRRISVPRTPDPHVRHDVLPRNAAHLGHPARLGVLYVCAAHCLHVVAGRVQPGDQGLRSVRSLATTRNRLGAAAFAVLLSGYGVHQAIQVPPIKRVSVEIPNLPSELDGLRIVQLSDLHISRLFDAPWTKDVVAKTNALDADMIVITGDLIDGTPEARQHDVKALGGLRAELGVIAIPGNHEYYFQEGRWRQIFEQQGMKVLINEHVIITRNQAQLAIAGITDEVAPNYSGAAPDLGQAISGIPESTPIVLLKHRPESARESANPGVSLQLSGHTHGGMILGLNQIACYANDGFISGMYQIGSMILYVSNGTALWNGFPIRLGVPPEITELTLLSSQKP